MYNFELLENETIEIISDNSLIKNKDEISNATTIITNKRFLILTFPKNTEIYRIGRTINYPAIKKEIILNINIDEIIEITKEKDFDKYILKDNQYFYLLDDLIKNHLKNHH